jgi:hypothetical protein
MNFIDLYLLNYCSELKYPIISKICYLIINLHSSVVACSATGLEGDNFLKNPYIFHQKTLFWHMIELYNMELGFS